MHARKSGRGLPQSKTLSRRATARGEFMVPMRAQNKRRLSMNLTPPNPPQRLTKGECRNGGCRPLDGFIERTFKISVVGSSSQCEQELRRGCPESHSRRRESAQLFGQWARPQRRAPAGAHLGSTTKVRRKRAPVAELESFANPQPGKAALRSARFPACGFWRLSNRQLVVLSRCAPPTVCLEILLAAGAGQKVAWSSCRGTANQRR